MEKDVGSDLFVNDGSFFEKFTRLEQEKAAAPAGHSKPTDSASSAVASKPFSIMANKRPLYVKGGDAKKTNSPASGGKLAFSLKQKSKVAVVPVKFTADDEEDGGEAEAAPCCELTKRQKLGQANSTEPFSHQADDAPSPPRDPAVRKIAERLAIFVAKNGRQLEHITRQKNPGDTPFKFLFDLSSPDYKYYEYRLSEEEKALAQSKDFQGSSTAAKSITPPPPPPSRASTMSQKNANYQTPASALYGTYEEASASGSDSIAMMEFYMKKAAHEERRKPPKQSKDEMPPPSSLQAPSKKGHHISDYIPPEELEKFLASCNDAAAQKAAKEASERAKIQADNIGHKLLSKMGWREGEGLGSDKSGRADPVMAGNIKLNNLGVGAHHPGEVTTDDDIYAQYKKRMMLGYRHRPNPLGNPRKAYY